MRSMRGSQRGTPRSRKWDDSEAAQAGG
ncbi:hypothetical protein NOCARDAX2BIS_50056 [Nocardioides sp. AX2bis]|nr:hypothetical protein NOCARDAX2BIS_50056 [Nocardioides sp. AX2bis]